MSRKRLGWVVVAIGICGLAGLWLDPLNPVPPSLRQFNPVVVRRSDPHRLGYELWLTQSYAEVRAALEPECRAIGGTWHQFVDNPESCRVGNGYGFSLLDLTKSHMTASQMPPGVKNARVHVMYFPSHAYARAYAWVGSVSPELLCVPRVVR